MSRHSTQNNLLTIVCPYRKWTDLYISNTIGQSSIQSKVITKESDIHELACEKLPDPYLVIHLYITSLYRPLRYSKQPLRY